MTTSPKLLAFPLYGVVEAYRLDRYDNKKLGSDKETFILVVEAYRLDRYDNSIEMPLWLRPPPRLAGMLKCRSFVWVEVSTNKALPRWGSWVRVGGKQKSPASSGGNAGYRI